MVLLVVDTQKGIVDERLYAFEKFVSNIRKLIRTAREQGIEVVYSYSGADLFRHSRGCCAAGGLLPQFAGPCQRV